MKRLFALEKRGAEDGTRPGRGRPGAETPKARGALDDTMKLRIATRRSALALVQTNWVARRLCEARARPRVRGAVRAGHHSATAFTDCRCREIGGKGLFVSELEQARARRHSRLRGAFAEGRAARAPQGLRLRLRARARGPARRSGHSDGLELDDLPGGRPRRHELRCGAPCSCAGSAGPRECQLRGNVDTRSRKCREGELEAIVLAQCGAGAPGARRPATEVLEPELMLPAVGQERSDSSSARDELGAVGAGARRITRKRKLRLRPSAA